MLPASVIVAAIVDVGQAVATVDAVVSAPEPKPEPNWAWVCLIADPSVVQTAVETAVEHVETRHRYPL